MRRCFDCKVSMPVDGTDSCQPCQDAHDEREAAAAYCRAEHSGIGCNCESLAWRVMNSVDLSALEQRLVEACEAARADGYTIKPGMHSVIDEGCCCCAVGSLLVGVRGYGFIENVVDETGVSESIIDAVSHGFEGWDSSECDPDAYAIGQRLRQRYVGGAL